MYLDILGYLPQDDTIPEGIYGVSGASSSFSIPILIAFISVIIALYIYTSLAFMKIAKRTRLSYPGTAWIPSIGPLITAFRISKMHWWPWLFYGGIMIGGALFERGVNDFDIDGSGSFLILAASIYFFSLLGFFVFSITWNWKMFKAVSRPGWWALTLLGFPLLAFTLGFLFALAFYGDATLMFFSALISSLALIIIYLIFIGVAAWGKGKAVSARKTHSR